MVLLQTIISILSRPELCLGQFAGAIDGSIQIMELLVHFHQRLIHFLAHISLTFPATFEFISD